MARLLVLVEGETEETFVKSLLAGPLYEAGYTQVRAKLIGDSREDPGEAASSPGAA